MAMATLAAARRVAALGRFQSSNVSASALVPRRGFAGAADHHGPANVNCWSGNWKEEHFVIVSLAGWSTLIYGSYKFFTKGKKEEKDEDSNGEPHLFREPNFKSSYRRYKHKQGIEHQVPTREVMSTSTTPGR
ncbi:hypothetical protein LINPERHAP2_LOCUS23691 [Linum perenne]